MADQPKSNSTPGSKTEAEFLQRQADDASKAIGKALGDARRKLMQGINLNSIAKEHPWATVAAGAVAGFATGAVVTPNKRDAALKRLAEIERALRPMPPHMAAAYADGNGHAGTGKPSSSLLTSALSGAFALLKPVLLSSLTAAVAGHTAANQAAETTSDMNAAQAEST